MTQTGKDTIDSKFLLALERFPDRRFLTHVSAAGIAQLSYGDAALRIAAMATKLRDAGISSGSRIVIYTDDILPSLYVALACWHMDVTWVGLSPLFSVAYLRRVAAKLDARAVFTSAEHAPSVIETGLRTLCMPGPVGVPAGAVDLSGSGELSRAEAFRVLSGQPEHGADAIATVIATSGSTGEPKLVPRTHESWLFSARNFSFGMELGDELPQRIFLNARMTHAFGIGIVATGCYLGAEFCVPSALDVDSSLEDVRRLDATYLPLTPRVVASLYRQYAEAGGDGRARWLGPSARIVLSAGGAAPVQSLRLLESQGVSVVDNYGASEVSDIACSRPGMWREGYVGKIIEGVTAKLAEDGELLVRTPAQMTGYIGEEEQTRQAFTEDGFYRTGDFAEITPDGWLRILGRKRDIFNTNEGSNIFPARIEQAIEELHWVRQAVLIGDRRPFVSALIVVKDGAGSVSGSEGFMAPERNEAAYARARVALQELNTRLEIPEQVRAFALFDREMDPKLYQSLGLKQRRDRKGVAQVYGDWISLLYSGEVQYRV